MSIRIIVMDPDPVLREVAKEVTKFNSNLKKLLKDMAETMYDAQGVGLAAPQIGISKRVIVVDIGDEETGLIEMVNPVILSTEGDQLGPEGCLSIPHLNGEVLRADHIVIQGQNSDGQMFTMEASGYLARAFQHEVDHLNGILFTDIARSVYDITESQSKGGE